VSGYTDGNRVRRIIVTADRAPAFQAIMVPLDGSVFAEQALAAAAAQARKAGAVLHLVSVHEPISPVAMSDTQALCSDLDVWSRTTLTEYLKSVSAAVESSHGLTIKTAVRTGRAAASLCEYAESQQIDLVVMTTHGRGGPMRWWLGSVADRMLRRLAMPVLLLHPREPRQPCKFRRILLALDGEIEEPLLETAFALSGVDPAPRWVLTRVVEPAIPVVTGLASWPGRLPPGGTKRREIEARNYLARLAERLRVRGVKPTQQVLVGRDVATQVLELATAMGADCIVVGTHGASGMERVLLGSVSDKIVRGSEIPVLIVPAAVGATRPRATSTEVAAGSSAP
jgi:nucleotide-binding universal stress UspA family protein